MCKGNVVEPLHVSLFYTISNGGYAEKLFSIFGKDRVESELEDFLALDFFPRSGGGIGVTRIMSALEDKNKVKAA